jgi:RimJ/RimL family protein N-acetyltransferase
MTPHLADTPVLETERLILRGPKPTDLDLWAAFAVSDRAKFIGGPLEPKMAFRAWCTVLGHWAIRGFGMFVLEPKDGSAPIGHVGNWEPMGWPEREIGWTLWDASAEGKGYAYEAARAVVDYTFGTLGWNTAVSYIDDGNHRSVALARRLGAVLDDTAETPDRDEPPILVYRHRPEARP